MALTPNDQTTMDDFRDVLTDRFISDYQRTTMPADRAKLAGARRKACAVVGGEAEYLAAVFAAERAALWQTGRAMR
jgi:hypothetical protein